MSNAQTILITGATAGIGKHTAIYLYEKGHRVIATGRNERALAALRELGLSTVAMDVTSRESIQRAVECVRELTDGKGVDVLVNNAGYGLLGPLEELSDEDVRAQFETNVFGLLAVTRAFLPAMHARGSGRVINVSSVGGRMVFPLGGAYHATKFAVEAMSDALRIELKQFGIDVSVIEPGYIATEFTATTVAHARKYQRPDSPYASAMEIVANAENTVAKLAVGPQSVARAIEHAATSRWPRARYVAPFYNALGPWMISMLPTVLTDWFMRRAAGLYARKQLASPRATA